MIANLNPNKKGNTLMLIYWIIAFAIVMLFTGCKSTPPTIAPAQEIVKLPAELQSLPIGASVNWQGSNLLRINDSMAVKSNPVAPVIEKCKNCFNTVDKSKDNSKDKSDHSESTRIKDNSDYLVKDKSDNSRLKKAEIDNSIGKPEKGSGFMDGLWSVLKGVGLVILLFGIAYILVKSFS